MKLFDVKDDRTDFSCDFTKAFWIWSCVVFSMSPVKEQKIEGKKKTKKTKKLPKPFLSSAVC